MSKTTTKYKEFIMLFRMKTEIPEVATKRERIAIAAATLFVIVTVVLNLIRHS